MGEPKPLSFFDNDVKCAIWFVLLKGNFINNVFFFAEHLLRIGQ